MSPATVFKNPILTVDAVILSLVEGQLVVALMKRAEEPFAGALALPGGYVHADPQAGRPDASTTAAMLRILKDKLGFKPSHLEQVMTESGQSRDPRGWSASVVHMALHHEDAIRPLVEAGKVELHPTSSKQKLKGLAFDHKALIETTVQRLRAKATYSTIVAHLLPEVFSMSDLQEAYEVVTGEMANRQNFRRKMLEADVLVEAELLRHSGGRPAQGYRLKEPFSVMTRALG